MSPTNAALRIPTTNKGSKIMLSAKATSTRSDKKLLSLIQQHKDTAGALEENFEKQAKLRGGTGSLKCESFVEFPAHLDYFYPESHDWYRNGKWFLSRTDLDAFNREVEKQAKPYTPDNIEEYRESIPLVNWDEAAKIHNARVPKYEEMAATSQKRIDWLEAEELNRKQEYERCGLASLEKENEELLDKSASLSDEIIETLPHTIEGFKAKAEWIMEDAEMMKSSADNWEYLQVKALVSGIKQFL